MLEEAFFGVVAPLGTALVLGGLLGMEREMRGRWAGLRTHMMVAMGSALFVLATLGDPAHSADGLSRTIQGIAAGVGFIGAGTILKLTNQLEIKGLTTASSIWLAAAIGAAAGAKAYVPAVAALAIALPALVALGYWEKCCERAERIIKEPEAPMRLSEQTHSPKRQ